MTNKIPFPLVNPLVPFQCDTAGEAMKIQELARSHCLQATYHPFGGETAKHNIDPQHIVWITGSQEQFNTFKIALMKKSGEK